MSKIVKKIVDVTRFHWAVVVLGLMLTAIILLPIWSYPLVAKNLYRGINIAQYGTDEHFYLSRAKDVLEGHPLGNPILQEGKNGQDPFFTYNERILLAPFKFFGITSAINIVTLYNVLNGVGVFVLILLVYLSVWQISKNRVVSLVVPLFIIGGYSIIYSKSLFYTDFNIYGRAMYPYMSSIGFFLYFNALIASIKKPANKKYSVLAMVFFGLLFYNYFFAWSFAGALNGCLAVIYALKKDWRRLKNILAVLLGGLGIGSYNLVKLFLYMQTDLGKQLSYFQWSSHGRHFVNSKIGLCTMGLFALYSYRKRTDFWNPLIAAVILAGWVALNQQILTNRFVQYAHYYWYFIVPMSIFISSYMVWALVENNTVKKIFSTAIIILVFVNTVGGQYMSMQTTLGVKAYEQKFAPLLEVLNNKQPGVILTLPYGPSYLFVIYTANDLFWLGTATTYDTPLQTMKDALFVYVYLNAGARSNFKEYINRMMLDPSKMADYSNLFENLEGYLSGYDYYDYQRRLAIRDVSLLQKRPALIEQLYQEYQQRVVAPGAFIKILDFYDVRYIEWDENIEPEWDISAVGSFTEISRNGELHLYERTISTTDVQ